MKTVIVLMLGFVLLGCAGPKKIGGNSHSVTFDNIYHHNVSRVYSMANRHCARYEKKAKLITDRGSSMSFECVN